MLSNFPSNKSAWDRHLARTFENFKYPHASELERGVWQMYSLCVTDGLFYMVLLKKKEKEKEKGKKLPTFDLDTVCPCSKKSRYLQFGTWIPQRFCRHKPGVKSLNSAQQKFCICCWHCSYVTWIILLKTKQVLVTAYLFTRDLFSRSLCIYYSWNEWECCISDYKKD